jgi:iron complex transport system ATP-binding protein
MLLNCDNLHFSYADNPVLKGISFTLQAGEVVALLGPNGSGKSTLIRCLLGQLPASGEVRWDDNPLQDWPRRELARRVAYLAQALVADPMHRVSDVLRMGRAPYLQAFGIESARDVQVVREVAQTLELTDLLNRRMDELSGGQRQRVFLGRCLVQEPAVLLLDEPNTYLDLRHQVELGQLLNDLARNKNLAVLMASHDLNLAGQFADRLILLSDGQIAADGPPRDVLRPDVLATVYGVPMERLDRGGAVHVFPLVERSRNH